MSDFALTRQVIPLILLTALYALEARGLSIGNTSFSTPAINTLSSASALSLTDLAPYPSLASSLPQTSNAYNSSFHDISVECNGRLYGRPLAASCLDAWRLMPFSEGEITYADRSQEISSDVILPWIFRT